MKKILLLSFILIGILSCSKDDGLGLKSSMSATIDNDEWKAITSIAVLNDGKFIITGTDLTGKSLSITIMGTSEGEYVLPATSLQIAAVYKESLTTSTEDAFIASSGTVELTEVNTTAKEISGTFSLVVRRDLTESTITIEEGTFSNVKYTESE